MTMLFTILLGLSLLVTLGVLLVGLVGMTKPEFNKKYGNILMRLRIAAQLSAVVFFLLIVLSRYMS
ncbi:MAG: HIG1 domain-containing protein [Alphaproteobacteria bacterium]